MDVADKVSSQIHLPLSVIVSEDVPVGVYWYSIAAIPEVHGTEKSQNIFGYIAAFAIDIISTYEKDTEHIIKSCIMALF